MIAVNEVEFYALLLRASWLLALITAVYLLFVPAPYGRHTRRGYGPSLSAAGAWLLMEAPAALLPLALFAWSDRHDLVTTCFLLIWEAHYAQRAFLDPLQMRGRGTRVPIAIALSGATFNVLNGYLNFRYLTHLGPTYSVSWLTDPRFVGGLLVFALGYAINRRADRRLRRLRAPGETGYKIPHGGLFRYVSCPNYFGELLEWSGWALLTFSLPGLFFALFTAANLVPRAISHHRDYRRRFPEYPPERRAVLPFVL